MEATMQQFFIDDPMRYYFCTDTIMGGRGVFTDPPAFDIIIESLEHCRVEKGLCTHAYVILPDHMHLILSSESTEVSSIVRDYKRFTSRQLSTHFDIKEDKRLLAYFHNVAMHTSRGTDYTVWQRGDPPVLITSRTMFQQKLELIHQHPVRSGFVEKPEYWKYSSARNYIFGDDSILTVNKFS